MELSDLGFDDVGTNLCQLHERAGFIGGHESRVGDDVGCQNRCEPALLLRQSLPLYEGCCRLDVTARARNRCHETIAASGQCYDVPGTIFSIAERLAQARHVNAQSVSPTVTSGQTCDNSSFLPMTSLCLETRAIRMSRARAPNLTGAPSLVSSRSPGARRKGPNESASLLGATVGTIALSATTNFQVINQKDNRTTSKEPRPWI